MRRGSTCPGWHTWRFERRETPSTRRAFSRKTTPTSPTSTRRLFIDIIIIIITVTNNTVTVTDRIDRLVGAIEAQGRPRTRIAFVGFSQGACLATEYVYRHPARWAGLAALTGGLIGPPEKTWSTSGSLDQTSVLLCTADPDAWVPAHRVRQTADVLRAMGASVEMRIQPGAAHEITAEAIRATRSLLAGLSAPGHP